MTTKHLFTVTAFVLLFVAVTWFAAPHFFYAMLGVAPSDALLYMGRRYSAYIFGLSATMWMSRPLLASEARRAIMMGAFVAMALTGAASLYGVLAGRINVLGLGAGATEALLAACFGYFLFIKPEPDSSKD